MTCPSHRPTPEITASLRSIGLGIGRLLGSGAMSAVYSVRRQDDPDAPFDPDAPNAPYEVPELALKVLHAEHIGNLELVLRFLNEERAAARTHHPAVIRVHGSGMIAAQPYLLLERLADTLAQRVPALSRVERVAVAAQVASGAAALHRVGVVHRDLKPLNVMFAPGPELTAKIVDLGLAKLSTDPQTLPVSTAATEVLGTAEYRAPELWISSKSADERTDVYALGIMLYELLSGRLPFHSPRESLLMDMHLFAPPPSLPQLPARIAALLPRMLAKERAQRPAMTQVAEALTSVW